MHGELTYQDGQRSPPRKLQIADYSTLKPARDVAATKCSEQLLNKFLGK